MKTILKSSVVAAVLSLTALSSLPAHAKYGRVCPSDPSWGKISWMLVESRFADLVNKTFDLSGARAACVGSGIGGSAVEIPADKNSNRPEMTVHLQNGRVDFSVTQKVETYPNDLRDGTHVVKTTCGYSYLNELTLGEKCYHQEFEYGNEIKDAEKWINPSDADISTIKINQALEVAMIVSRAANYFASDVKYSQYDIQKDEKGKIRSYREKTEFSPFSVKASETVLKQLHKG